MSRAVTEWVGKTDDSPAPPRVRRRIFEREKGVCYLSGRKISPGEAWQLDHRVALINGGRNCETNLFPALGDPHKEKTRADLAEKKRVAARALSNIGVERKKQKIPAGPSSLSTKPKNEPRERLAPRKMFEDITP